ncbi:MAG: hypothetical protein ACFFDM_00905 [Candidatus Thorarchaeota archaeon]
MEEMKITSKTLYNRARVRNGYGPHRMLKMIHEKKFQKSLEAENKYGVTK